MRHRGMRASGTIPIALKEVHMSDLFGRVSHCVN